MRHFDNLALAVMRRRVSGAVERGEGKAIRGLDDQFSFDFAGWHIWVSTARRCIIANGPDAWSRALEFRTPEAAIRWFRAAGLVDLAARLANYAGV